MTTKLFFSFCFLFFLCGNKIIINDSQDAIFCFACSECNKVIYFQQEGKNLWPNSLGCSVSGWHSWCNIGIVGNIKSKCKYCKIKVRTKFDPLGCSGDKKECSVSKREHYFVKY